VVGDLVDPRGERQVLADCEVVKERGSSVKKASCCLAANGCLREIVTADVNRAAGGG